MEGQSGVFHVSPHGLPGDRDAGVARPGDGVSQRNPEVSGAAWAPACCEMTPDACDDRLPSK